MKLTMHAHVSPFFNNTYNFKRTKLWFNQPNNSKKQKTKKKTGEKNVLVKL